MANETLNVGQLICNSTTPPPDRGFFKVDDTTTGHVGTLKVFDPVTNQPSTVITATPSGPGLEIQDGSDTRSFLTAEMSGGVPTGNFS